MKYQENLRDQYDPQVKQFKSIIQTIPDCYLGQQYKTQIQKNKENDLQRIIQAKIMFKTGNEWSIQNLLEEGKKKKQAKNKDDQF